MSALIDPRFVHINLDVATYEDALATLTNSLRTAGVVKDSFLAAIVERERTYPTGLPVGGGVAMPHADPEHVNDEAIAVATLAHPVHAGEMAGEPDSTVEISTIFLLAFTDGAKHLQLLKALVKTFQDNTFMSTLGQQKDAAELAAAVNQRLAA